VFVLLGKKIKSSEPIPFSLKKIYGLGHKQILSICDTLGISNSCSFEKLTESKIIKLKDLLQSMVIGSEKAFLKSSKIKVLLENKSYRGFRHLKKLPVRGQRTKTNAKTRKKGII
jgi:small subunit ribosomal protein S13